MFSRARYVIVDDEREQLRPLVEALHELGAPCLGIHYNAEHGIPDGHFRGVRILFMDLHLQSAAAGDTANYAIIAGILERSIVPGSGPYILVLWTSHSEEREAFSAYIAKAVPLDHRPLTILALDKKTYLAKDNENPEQLRADVEAAVTGDVRLKALLSWEHDVLTAAGATLAEIGSLIPEADRTVDRYSDAMDRILSLLAVAAAGAGNAARDPRGAVSSALAPILADRIISQEPSEASAALWGEAVTRTEDLPKLDSAQAGRMNTMVHLALPGAEDCAPTDWGAVVELPDEQMTEVALVARFGHPGETIFKDLFKVDPAKLPPRPRFCVVRTGAVCDHAQGRTGPILYVLGLLIPPELSPMKKKPPTALNETPILWLPDVADPRLLLVNARLQVSMVPEDVAGWKVLFRIREQLLAQVVMHNSGYVTRPGTLSFYPS